MADYTKQIFEMLGVEPEEEFILKFDGCRYIIDNELKVWAVKNGKWTHGIFTASEFLRLILVGECKIIKIPHPTAEEQLAIDYARACGCKWIARDEDKVIFAYGEKPEKDKGAGAWHGGGVMMVIYLPISFIHWEDEEPHYIGD